MPPSRFPLFLLLLLTACHRDDLSSAPLTQRAYIWQRDWTPAVSEAAKHADSTKLDSLILFGAEIVWDHGKPKPVRCSIDWPTVRSLHKPVSIAMRIAPFPGPFSEHDSITQTLTDTASSLLTKLNEEHIPCTEFQLDFDCAQKKLAGYALWLKTIRAAIRPTRFVITTLPAWLGEPEFAKLVQIPDSYVLQVHSVAPPKADEHVSICDQKRAREWVNKAAALGRPFDVALSTYSALAGYDASGRFIGMALDGVQPAWPSGTRVMQFDSDADDLSALVREWNTNRPATLQSVIWYRLPVTTDQRNWRWPTFAAVVEGRALNHDLRVQTTGDNLIDLTLINAGEADENLDHLQVRVRWDGSAPVASDALPGFILKQEPQLAVYEFAPSQRQHLSPGAQRSMGWLRFDQRASLHVEIVR